MHLLLVDHDCTFPFDMWTWRKSTNSRDTGTEVKVMRIDRNLPLLL